MTEIKLHVGDYVKEKFIGYYGIVTDVSPDEVMVSQLDEEYGLYKSESHIKSQFIRMDENEIQKMILNLIKKGKELIELECDVNDMTFKLNRQQSEISKINRILEDQEKITKSNPTTREGAPLYKIGEIVKVSENSLSIITGIEKSDEASIKYLYLVKGRSSLVANSYYYDFSETIRECNINKSSKKEKRAYLEKLHQYHKTINECNYTNINKAEKIHNELIQANITLNEKKCEIKRLNDCIENNQKAIREIGEVNLHKSNYIMYISLNPIIRLLQFLHIIKEFDMDIYSTKPPKSDEKK